MARIDGLDLEMTAAERAYLLRNPIGRPALELLDQLVARLDARVAAEEPHPAPASQPQPVPVAPLELDGIAAKIRDVIRERFSDDAQTFVLPPGCEVEVTGYTPLRVEASVRLPAYPARAELAPAVRRHLEMGGPAGIYANTSPALPLTPGDILAQIQRVRASAGAPLELQAREAGPVSVNGPPCACPDAAISHELDCPRLAWLRAE